MKTLSLKRAYLDNCTIGKMYADGKFLCYTIERAWLNNEKNISCIPAGTYDLKKRHSKRFGNVFYLEAPSLGVSLNGDTQRTYILIHAANYAQELQGCIAPGLFMNPTKYGVIDSKDALKKIMDFLGANESELVIV